MSTKDSQKIAEGASAPGSRPGAPQGHHHSHGSLEHGRKPHDARYTPHDHDEEHFHAPESVRDVVIGMADGLTVPFALAAGLSGAVGAAHVVVLAGLAEIAAGSIAMGLGGYLAARGDAEHFASEKLREEREIIERTECEEQEIYDIFLQYGVTKEESEPVLQALKRNPTAWVDFMMQFELGLEEPKKNRARNSALTISAAYIFGGMIPLAPYMIATQTAGSVQGALDWSVVITLTALALFGAIKGKLTGQNWLRSGLQTVLIGGAAAAAAYGIAGWLNRG